MHWSSDLPVEVASATLDSRISIARCGVEVASSEIGATHVLGFGCGSTAEDAAMRARSELVERLTIKLATPHQRKARAYASAAGSSREMAERNALLELIERHSVGLWWYGDDRPVSSASSEDGDIQTLRAILGPIPLPSAGPAQDQLTPDVWVVAFGLWDSARQIAAFGSAARLDQAAATAKAYEEAVMVHDGLSRGQVPSYSKQISQDRFRSLAGSAGLSHFETFKLRCGVLNTSVIDQISRRAGTAILEVKMQYWQPAADDDLTVAEVTSSNASSIQLMRNLHESSAPLDPFC